MSLVFNKKMKIYVKSILGLKKAIGSENIVVDIPEGSSVDELFLYMVETMGEKVMPYLFDRATGNIHPYIRIILNGKQLNSNERKKTLLKDGDEIVIIPFAAGG